MNIHLSETQFTLLKFIETNYLKRSLDTTNVTSVFHKQQTLKL